MRQRTGRLRTAGRELRASINGVVCVAGDLEVWREGSMFSLIGPLGPTLLVVFTLCFSDEARTPTASTTVAVKLWVPLVRSAAP